MESSRKGKKRQELVVQDWINPYIVCRTISRNVSVVGLEYVDIERSVSLVLDDG